MPQRHLQPCNRSVDEVKPEVKGKVEASHQRRERRGTRKKKAGE